MRTILAVIIVPVMKVTGFRFSKEYRRAEKGFKKWVYDSIDVIRANIWAGI